MNNRSEALKKVDKSIFIPSAIIAIALILWSCVSSESFIAVFSVAFNFLLDKFGWLYILSYTVWVVLLVWIAFSKYGKIRLGAKQNEKPEFKTFTWIAMLFAAGQGVGLTYYALSEAIEHCYLPPWAVDAWSMDAVNNSIPYTVFHFGVHPWGGYALVGLCVAYFAYNKNAGGLLSTPLTYRWGKKLPDGTRDLTTGWGKVIDSYTVICSLLGICASMCLAVGQVSAGLGYVFHVPQSSFLWMIVLIVCTVIVTITSGAGVSKGMAFLSNANMKLCYILIAAVFVLGPTIDILNNLVEQTGRYITNLIPMSFYMDAMHFGEEKLGYNWLFSWTTFWWAYYLAWTPFVGIFVAKASRGRTIRQFVFGALLMPTVFCILWITAFGTAGIVLDQAADGKIYNDIVTNFATCLYSFYEELPLSIIWMVCTVFICTTFILTSVDSANYTISVLVCRGEINPPGIIRSFWAVVICGFALVFYFSGGSANIQTLQFTGTLPLVFIMYAQFVSFYLQIKEDYKNIYTREWRLVEYNELKQLDESIRADKELQEYMGVTMMD